MDRNDEPTRFRPPPQTSQPSQPAQPALLALAHAPLDPAFKTRGPGWRLFLGLILLIGLGALGTLLATGSLRELGFTESFEDY